MVGFLLHSFIPETTYGVEPDAEIPITISFFDKLYGFKSSQACVLESSAYSWDFLIALSPPAIIPYILSSIPKVAAVSCYLETFDLTKRKLEIGCSGDLMNCNYCNEYVFPLLAISISARESNTKVILALVKLNHRISPRCKKQPNT